MKRNLLFSLTLVSLLSAQAFAMEIVGGKLISHTESTKGAPNKISFKEIKATKNELAKLKNNFVNAHYAYATAKVTKIHWEPYGYIFANEKHTYWVGNQSESSQKYDIEKWICVIEVWKDGGEAVQNCNISNDEVDLLPGGYVYENTKSTLYSKMNKDPKVNYEAYTSIRIRKVGSERWFAFDTDDRLPLEKDASASK